MPRASSKRQAASISPSIPSCTRSPSSIECGIDDGDAARERFDEGQSGGDAVTLAGGEWLTLHGHGSSERAAAISAADGVTSSATAIPAESDRNGEACRRASCAAKCQCCEDVMRECWGVKRREILRRRRAQDVVNYLTVSDMRCQTVRTVTDSRGSRSRISRAVAIASSTLEHDLRRARARSSRRPPSPRAARRSRG